MTRIHSTPTDAREPAPDPVVEAPDASPPGDSAELAGHPEQDPLAMTDPPASDEPSSGEPAVRMDG